MSYYRRTKEEKQDCKNWYLNNWGRYKSHKWKKKHILRIEIEDVLKMGVFSKTELIELLVFLRKKGLNLPPTGVGETKGETFLTKQDMEL